MRRQHLDVNRHQSIGCGDAFHGNRRIELIFRDQALKIWNLECYHPLRRQEVGHAGDKVVERGYLGQNVVGGD